MLHELGAGGETGDGDRLQRRPAPFQIGQQVIHGVERAGFPAIIQTAFDPGAAAPQGVPLLRRRQPGGTAAGGKRLRHLEQRGDQQAVVSRSLRGVDRRLQCLGDIARVAVHHHQRGARLGGVSVRDKIRQ